LWNEALEAEATNIQLTSIKQGKINELEVLPASVYTKPTQCRLKRAYANAYATYALCMGAYAWGMSEEFPL